MCRGDNGVPLRLRKVSEESGAEIEVTAQDYSVLQIETTGVQGTVLMNCLPGHSILGDKPRTTAIIKVGMEYSLI